MNAKHISLAFAAITIASLLAGCAKSPIEEVKPSEQLTDLELSYVGATETKAAIDGTSFPEEGEIGLFLFGDEEATKAYGTGYENVKYSYNSSKGKWTASPSIKVGSETGYLYGYYPYKAGTQEQPITVKAIPVASSLNGDDVMYATKVGGITDANASQTSITMNHALARVSITVKNNGYAGEAKLTKIKLSEAEITPTGTLNATNGSITATKSAVTLDVPSANQTLTTAGTSYECLLVPSAVISSRQKVALTLTIDGEDKTATLSGDNGVIIAQGTKSNITITLSNSGISVQTVSVEDWTVVEVGGHKVTVKLSDDAGIAENLYTQILVGDDYITIGAYSKVVKPLIIRTGNGSLVAPVENGNISTFTISNITSEIIATLAYAKSRTVTVNTKVDKAPNVEGYIYGTAEPITLIEGRPSTLTATSGEGYALDYFNVKGTKYSDKAEVLIPDDVETIDAYFRFSDWLSGVFTVSDDGKGNVRKVRFSRGNLWFGPNLQATNFNFETNQYDSTPTFENNRDENHISHFSWCKIAELALYEGYSEIETTSNDNLFTNASPTEPNGSFAVNGQKGFWRALSGGTDGEWEYLISRKDKTGKDLYKCGVTVCGRSNCLVLLHDDWEWDANTVGAEWQTEYSESTTVKWSTMEASGAVCLPAAGFRVGIIGSPHPALVSSVDHSGYYWSASPNGRHSAYDLGFDSGNVDPSNYNNRNRAYSVRLVTDVK